MQINIAADEHNSSANERVQKHKVPTTQSSCWRTEGQMTHACGPCGGGGALVVENDATVGVQGRGTVVGEFVAAVRELACVKSGQQH